MKRFLLIIAACFPAIGLLAADVEPMPADTVIRLENKRIVVKDNGERMKVKVYELTEEGDSIDREMIFEGITGTDRVTNGANISSRSISRSFLGQRF